MSNRSFRRSLQKSEWAIALFLLFSKEQPKERSTLDRAGKQGWAIALFKRANEQAIAQSLFWKKGKWVMSEWANEYLPNPAARVGHLLILKMSDLLTTVVNNYAHGKQQDKTVFHRFSRTCTVVKKIHGFFTIKLRATPSIYGNYLLKSICVKLNIYRW